MPVEYRKKGEEFWLGDEGIALVSGWRRNGFSFEEVCKMAKISKKAMSELALRDERLDRALRRDRVVTDYIVEEAVLLRAVSGDLKACELWLKTRMPEIWGGRTSGDKAESRGQAELYATLGEWISKPEERFLGEETDYLNEKFSRVLS